MGKRFYFLDTYALIEIIRGNPKYNKLLERTTFTCLFNLYELYYSLLRDFNKRTAEYGYNLFSSLLIDIKKDHLFHASEVKLQKKISYVDALGRAISDLENFKFVTGDNDFKDDKDVLFLK